MKIVLEYVTDAAGEPRAVQLPIAEWKRVLSKLAKYEQASKLKSDLKEAFAELAEYRTTRQPRQTLNEFLNEL